MHITLCTFTSPHFARLGRMSLLTAKLTRSFDSIKNFNSHDIPDVFYEEKKEFFNIKRGFGLWIWKPYFVKKCLTAANEGDILVYCDASVFFLRSIREYLIEGFKNSDILAFQLPFEEEFYTSKNVLDKVKIYDSRGLTCDQQYHATFFALKKSRKSVQIIDEWLNACSDLKLLRGDEFFANHRHDQSLLSVILKNHNIMPAVDPSFQGVLPELYFSLLRRQVGQVDIMQARACAAPLKHCRIVFIKRLPLLKSVGIIFVKSIIILVRRIYDRFGN